MKRNVINIFCDLPESSAEVFENLIQNDNFKLERIISRGQATAEGQWYDQSKDEWVMLLKGSAALKFEGDEELIILKPGDYILIPAHLKHRVEWTDKTTETLWLAIHY
ncbi:cupin domain-containing protein [Bacteroidetes/Chlorobi group bacterium ChocPot_Mid]|jgi:cupin 2 domain-containing protein|nr:MAG: cupin domain-containing protein [Bacteroidetes/Chlorobi group bacterium ChocPot_Mid]